MTMSQLGCFLLRVRENPTQLCLSKTQCFIGLSSQQLRSRSSVELFDRLSHHQNTVELTSHCLFSFFCAVTVVHLLSCVRHFAAPQTAACQAPLSSTVSQFAQIHAHGVSEAFSPSSRDIKLLKQSSITCTASFRIVPLCADLLSHINLDHHAQLQQHKESSQQTRFPGLLKAPIE